MGFRFAAPADSAALLKIYGEYLDTPITFECALPSEAEFAGRIAAIGQEYPYLVCLEKGRIVGYAYADRQAERAAYQWNAELSVYLDRDCTGRGVGRRLYSALMDILRLQGIPGGADRGGRSALELLQLLPGHRIELQQVPLQEPAGAPHCAVDAVHFPAVQRLRHRAIQRTVQNSGGTPAVDNDQISLHCPSSSQQRLVPFPAFHSRRAQLTWEYCTITVGIGQG